MIPNVRSTSALIELHIEEPSPQAAVSYDDDMQLQVRPTDAAAETVDADPRLFSIHSLRPTPNSTATSMPPQYFPPSPAAPVFAPLPPSNRGTLHNYLAQVATNASMVMSIPEVWNVQRPEDTPTYADYNETFRLYFGLNITIMPYVIMMGGYAGSLLCLLPIAVLLQESIASQLRAKVVVLTNIYKDFTKHDQIDTYLHLVDALWSQRRVSTKLTEVTRADGFTEMRRQEHVSFEVDSIFPRCVRGLILATQFTGACSFTMLMAENLQPLTELSLRPSLALACAMLTVLSTLYTPATCRYFAYVSNSVLIASVVMFLVALGMVSRDDGPRWTTPRSTRDVLMLLPFLTSALSPSLFGMDIEGSVSSRVIARAKQREEEETKASPAPVAMGTPGMRASVTGTPGTRPSITACGPALPYANALPDTHLPTLGRTIFLLNRFERLSFVALGLALAIHIGFGEASFAHFGQSTNPALALALPSSNLRTALLVVLTVGSGVGAAYSISAIGTVLDELGLSRVLCGITAGAADSEPSCQYTVIRRVESLLLRCILFCGVFGVLVAVPFFDVLSSLSGSLGFTNISMIVPAIMDLQAARRKLQAEDEEDRRLQDEQKQQEENENSTILRSSFGTHPADPSALSTRRGSKSSNSSSSTKAVEVAAASLVTEQHDVSWWRAFDSVRFRVKTSIVCMVVFGSFMTVSGTIVAIMVAVERQS